MIKKKWDMFAESVSMSLSNIAGNKMRTFLTTLGIIIGVGAIIALMTVVQGATDTMNAQFDAMGLGTLRVSVAGTAIKHGLTDDDLQTILDCEHVAGISPSRIIRHIHAVSAMPFITPCGKSGSSRHYCHAISTDPHESGIILRQRQFLPAYSHITAS